MRILTVALLIFLVISSISLVRLRHASRQQFVELQQLHKQRDELNIAWGQLQIEKRTYAKHDRIEHHAMGTLKMHVPRTEDVVIVTDLMEKASR